MRRTTFSFLFFCGVFLGTSGALFAQGGGRGWIERLSGPGPFTGWDYFGPVGCFARNGEARNRPAPFWKCYGVLREDNEPSWWIDFEFGDYESEDDPLVNSTTVDLKRWELRATTLVSSTKDIVEVGFGAGAYHFSGDFDGFAKLALPLRVAAYPLRAFCRDCPWTGVAQFWAKQTFLAGRITGADFGVPGSSFNENWESVGSFGVLIDVRWIARP
jgi:hypothetical protein